MRALFCVVAVACLLGCGTRTPDRDSSCSADKPKAYEKPPLFSSCSQVRTNESAIDTATGTRQDNIHRLVHCCP